MELQFVPPNEALSSNLREDLTKAIVGALGKAGLGPETLPATMRIRSFLTEEQLKGLYEGSGFGADRKRILDILAHEVVNNQLTSAGGTTDGDSVPRFPSPRGDRLHSTRELRALDAMVLGQWAQAYTWKYFSQLLADPQLKAKFGQYLNVCQERMRDVIRDVTSITPTGAPKALGDSTGSSGISKKHSDAPEKPLITAAKDMIRGRIDLKEPSYTQIILTNLKDKLETTYRNGTYKGDFLPSNPPPDSNMNLDIDVAMLRAATSDGGSASEVKKAWDKRLRGHYRGRFNFKGIKDPSGIAYELQVGSGNISSFYDEVELPTGKDSDALHVHDAAYKGADRVMSVVLSKKAGPSVTPADLEAARSAYLVWAEAYEDALDMIINAFHDKVTMSTAVQNKNEAVLRLQKVTREFFTNPAVKTIVGANKSAFEEHIYAHLPTA